MYTDGIIDAEHASQGFFGMDRFKVFISAHEQLSANRFADSFLQQLSVWSEKKSGKVQEDDLTLMVVDVCDLEVRT